MSLLGQLGSEGAMALCFYHKCINEVMVVFSLVNGKANVEADL